MEYSLLETNINSSKFIEKNLSHDVCQCKFLLDISKNNYDVFGEDICNIIQFYQSHGIFISTSSKFSINIYKSDVESFSISYHDSKIIIFLDVTNDLLFYQTDLTYEEYKYKQFTDKYKLWVSLIEKQNMIYIDNKNHSKGFCKVQENTHGTITWMEISQKQVHEDIPLYSNVTFRTINSRSDKLCFKQIHFVTAEQESIITPEIFNTLLYYKTIEQDFIEKLQKGQNKHYKHFYIEDSNILQQANIRSKFQSDCKMIHENGVQENMNRFIHVGYIPNALNTFNCKWCLQNISNAKNKSLENCPHILNMLVFWFQETLLPYIRRFFTFPSNYTMGNVNIDIIQQESISEIIRNENNLIHVFLKISSTTSLCEFKENVVYSVSEGDVLFMHSSKSFTNSSKEDVYAFIRF